MTKLTLIAAVFLSTQAQASPRSCEALFKSDAHNVMLQLARMKRDIDEISKGGHAAFAKTLYRDFQAKWLESVQAGIDLSDFNQILNRTEKDEAHLREEKDKREAKVKDREERHLIGESFTVERFESSPVLTPDLKDLLVFDQKGIRRLALFDGREVAKFDHFSGQVGTISSNSNSTLIAQRTVSGGRFMQAGVMRMFEAATGKQLYEHEASAVSFAPDKDVVATANEGIEFLEARTGKLIDKIELQWAKIDTLEYFADGKTLALAERAVGVKILDLATRQIRHAFPVGQMPALATDAKHQQIAISDFENSHVRVYGTDAGELRFTLTEPTEWVREMKFSRDGKYLVAATNATTFIWLAATGKLIQQISKVSSWGGFTAVTISADSRFLFLTENESDSRIRKFELN